MATTKYIDKETGKEIPKDHKVRMVDHFVTTLTVTIRSTSVICGGDLKQQLEKKWEVIGLPQVTESKAFV